MKRRWWLYLTGLLLCIVPAAAAVLDRFSLWQNAPEKKISVGVVICLCLCCIPLWRQIRNAIKGFAENPSAWGVWLALTIIFIIFDKVSADMLYICWVALPSSVIGGFLMAWAKKKGQTMNEFDGLLQGEKSTSRKDSFLQSLAENSAVIILTFMCLFFVTYVLAPAELQRTDAGFRITADAVITALGYEIVFFASLRKGSKLGMDDTLYKAARGKAVEMSSQTVQNGAHGLSDWLHEYTAAEQKNAVKAFLERHGIRYEAYLDWIERGRKADSVKFTPTARQRVVIRRAERIAPIRLTEEMLLSENGASSGRRGAPMTAEQAAGRDTFFSTIVTLLIVSCTVSVVFSTTTNITPATIAMLLIRLLGLLSRFFTGLSKGREAYTVRGVAYADWQVRMLTGFNLWRKKGSGI